MEAENRSSAENAFYVYLGAALIDDLLAEPKSDAISGRLLGCVECLEDPWYNLCWYAHARVGNGQADPLLGIASSAFPIRLV
ncbi:hypothetical protein HDF10_003088 [Edaphobacter lichenicola]|uniref:Uncharacterized protein n=1 Tax=Tunturiibacter lichenicola TaxID=2051959 RepID=A0A7W8J9E0_9BACT|nr:hypothetical protein [Edaphobacter lichenicola]